VRVGHPAGRRAAPSHYGMRRLDLRGGDDDGCGSSWPSISRWTQPSSSGPGSDVDVGRCHSEARPRRSLLHTRGCRAEESTVGLLEGRRGSPCLLRGYDTAGQGQCRSGATGHQQQTVDFSVGAQDFVRADGAAWRLLRNDRWARAQGLIKYALRGASEDGGGDSRAVTRRKVGSGSGAALPHGLRERCREPLSPGPASPLTR
jgi:hypothetical protein